MTPFCTLYSGIINLNNAERAFLDVKILFMCSDCNWLKQDNENVLSGLDQAIHEVIKKKIDERMPDMLNVEDEKRDENRHILPTIFVQEKPTIIEKQVDYIKPVLIKKNYST